jgi:hypothetical protein
MHLVKVDSIPDGFLRKTVNYAGEEVLNYFQERSRERFLLIEDGKLLAVMALFSPTMLSNRALIMFGPMADIEFTLPQIRRGRELSTEFFSEYPYNFYAELERDNPITIKFAKFFGLEFHSEHGNIHLYERLK